MRQVVNFLLTAVTLYLSAILLPNSVYIKDFKTLFIASVMLFIAEAVSVFVIFMLILAMILNTNLAGLLVSILAIFFVEIIALSLLDMWLPDLMIIGLWPKIVIAFILSFLRIPDTNN